MTWRRAVAWVLLVALTGCASSRVVRLGMGEGRSLEYAPPSWDRSIRVEAEDFEEALARLVLHVPLTLRPVQGWELVRASSTGATLDRTWQFTLRKDYGRWCRAHEAPGDCLSLLEDGLGLSPMDRLTVAVGLSLDSMRRSIAAAVEDTLRPQLFVALITTSMVSWVALAAAPEPVFTKAAAVLAAVLLVYLGVDSFLEVLRACAELKGAAERATTFQELEEAGERFGRVLGKEGARVFVLAVTVLVSKGTAGGSAWLASRMPLLPRFTEAAALGARQVGVELASVGEVSTVAVVEGSVAITLAPTAVAMVALGPGGGGSDSGGASVPSSEKLAANMQAAGIPRPEGTAAHHIVAGSAPEAARAREVLQRFGVGINDAANGVFLRANRTTPGSSPGAIHSMLHTRAYYDAVNAYLGQATSRREVLRLLEVIRQALLAGRFP
jgi:hypothetical protein